MPGALGEPCWMVETAGLAQLARSRSRAWETYRVVMMAYGRHRASPRRAADSRCSSVHHAGELAGIERLADDAGRGQRRSRRALQPTALAVMSAVSLWRARPCLPVNALALPELTTRAMARPGLMRARHHSTGADGHLERVNTPATVVPGSKQSQHDVGAARIADAGRRSGEPHARDGRHLRHGPAGARERRRSPWGEDRGEGDPEWSRAEGERIPGHRQGPCCCPARHQRGPRSTRT